MSENESRKPEDEAAANGGEWTDQKWPPFKAETESTEDGTAKDADYYREHPEEIGDFAQKVIEVRGSDIAENPDEDGNEQNRYEWDSEKRAHVDAHGVPREWAQMTGYLKKNPDQIDHVVEEYQNIKYFQEHPEDLKKFVQELIRLRGGEEGIREGEWDTKQVTHVDKDRLKAPRTYTHLIGYLQRNPGEIPRFVEEYMSLKAKEETSGGGDAPEEAPYVPEDEAATGEPVSEGKPEGDSEDKGDEEEGPTPRATEEEPADKPEGEPEGDGEDKGDEEEGPTPRAPEYVPGDTAETPEDEGYREWLRSHADSENIDDLHGKMEGESDEMFAKRREWEQLVAERAEKYPMFFAGNPGEYPEGVDHAAYDAFLKNHPDGTDETNEEWLKRVGLPTLADFLNGAKPFEPTVETSTPADDEKVEPHKKWSEMTEEEKKALIRKYPRKPGEKTAEWAARIGLKEGIPDDAEDGKEKEKSREEILKAFATKKGLDWLKKRYNMSEAALHEKTDDELRDLYDQFMKDRGEETEGGEKEKNLEREKMLRVLATKDALDWMMKRYNMTEDFLHHMTDEQLKDLYDEYMNRKKKGEKEPEDEKPPVPPVPPEKPEDPKEPESKEVDDPLVMARIDRTKDARAAAHDIAERMMSERMQNTRGKGIRGLAQRVIIGGMFREAAIARYEHRAYDMIRAKQEGKDVKELSDSDWATKSGLERFVTAYVDSYEDEMIHSAAGESMDVYRVEKDENGKEIVVHYFKGEDGKRAQETLESGAMYDATIQLRNAVKAYAETGDQKQFEAEIEGIKEELRGKGGDVNALMSDNHVEVAMAARARYEHGKGIDDIMAGFAFINGEARSNVRTEAHRDAVDKLTNAISNSRIGRFIPPEVAGMAASMIVRATQSGGRGIIVAGGTALVGTAALAPAIVPVVAGMFTAGVLASLRERNRVTSDRATQARRLAQSDERGVTQYDESMSETQYEMRDANVLTKNINEALASGDPNLIKQALAVADTAVAMSDDRKIDLIRYSSGNTDQIERERMDMDEARAKARAELKKQGVKPTEMADAVREATEMFENGVDGHEGMNAKDRAFRRLRRRRMASQGIRSAIVSGVMSVGSQEFMSLIRPDQMGVLEHLGVQIQSNNENATNTLLAGLAGFQTGRTLTQQLLTEQGVQMTEQEAALRGADPNTTVVRGPNRVIETQQEVKIGDFAEANENAHLSGYFGNGTKEYDGNELRGVYNATTGEGRGPWMRLKGDSWGSGLRVHTKDLTSENVGFLVTIKGHKILCPAVAGDKAGVFYPDYSKMDPTLATILRERQFGRIQGVYMPGTTTDGKIDCYSFWGYGGKDNATGTIMTTVRSEVPTYDVYTTTTSTVGVDRGVSSYVTFGGTQRRNLTLGRRAQGPKPTTTGGRPGTHVRQDVPNPTRDRKPNEERAPEPPTPPTGGGSGEVPPAAPTEKPVDNPAGNPSGVEAAPEPAPAPATETPSEVPPAAPTGETGGEGGAAAEAADTSAAESSAIPAFTGPLNVDSSDLRLNPTEAQIRETAAANGDQYLGDEAYQSVLKAIRGWNAMDDGVRRMYLRNGRYSNGYLTVLERAGLLQAEDTPARIQAKEAAEAAAEEAAINAVAENDEDALAA